LPPIWPFHKQWGSCHNNPLVAEKGMTAREARAIDAEGKGGGFIEADSFVNFQLGIEPISPY